MLSYKGWQMTLAFEYNFGGQVYNLTRAKNVENVNPRNNVDRRAFEQRWKNVNDVPPYLDIANASDRENYHTSRFVEDDNNVICRNIELSYEFNSEILKKAGFKRGFTFSISPTF